MFPRLVKLSDVTETILLDLKENEDFSIGRIDGNSLPLPHVSISRRHCLIAFSDERFTIKDLESHNGTYVNDSRIKEKTLEHGDRLRIGNFDFLFLTEASGEESTPRATFDDGLLITKSDIFIVPEKARIAGDLNVLLKLGKAINEAENAGKLQKSFLKIILETVPAERGAILLFEDDSETPASICVQSDDPKMTVSRTVTERVRREKIALISNELGSLENAESIMATRVTSVLCVPLKNGVIYLDASDGRMKFTENHLQLMTAVSFLVSAALEQFVSISDLQNENLRLRESLQIETSIIGESPQIRKILELAAKVAKSDSNVLIIGESGTGKEMVAQTIHRNSTRAKKPFTAINCAVLTENLMESELFGHERGAFTGAFAQKQGKFEIADGGTLFLDEISELPLSLQAKLLRVLQEREFERVGGTRTLKTNVRIIAATNRNLSEAAKNGSFREDLFYRLNVVQIKTPPLRERRADISLLVQHFIEKHAGKCSRKIVGIARQTREILQNYEWRGNVRELENVIERAVVIGSTEMILPEDLPDEITENTELNENLTPDFHQQVKKAKAQIVLSAIEESDRNYTEAARRLGIHPNNLHRIIRGLGLKEKIN